MNITSKFIDSGTRKFARYPCNSYVRDEHENWPEVAIQITFSVRNADAGEMEVRMSNEEAEKLVLAILTQTTRNRALKAEYLAKTSKVTERKDQ